MWKERWRSITGSAGWVYLAITKALDAVGYIDTVLAHQNSRTKTWVGHMLDFLLNPPNWIIVPLFLGGLMLILWDIRRSRNKLVTAPSEASAPPDHAGGSFSRMPDGSVSITGGAGHSGGDGGAVNIRAGDGGVGGPGGAIAITGGTVVEAAHECVTPIWEVIRHVGAKLNDSTDNEAFSETRRQIRRALLAGHLHSMGRKEFPDSTNYQNAANYSQMHTDIAASYWATAEVNPLASSPIYDQHHHTSPESTRAWGDRGWDEPSHYADLRLCWAEVRALWP